MGWNLRLAGNKSCCIYYMESCAEKDKHLCAGTFFSAYALLSFAAKAAGTLMPVVSVTLAFVLELKKDNDPAKKFYNEVELDNVIRVNMQKLMQLAKAASDKEIVLFIKSIGPNGIFAISVDASNGV